MVFPANSPALVSIQLLRTIAVLSVVYSHYSTPAAIFPNAGHAGVDIFFIISGFVIAYVTSKSIDSFLIKRLIRICPMYTLVTIVTVLGIIIFTDTTNKPAISVSSFFKSILFIPLVNNNGFPSIVPQGWSLYYEVFFYVAMFLCILFVRNKKYLTFFCIIIIISVVYIMDLMHIEDSILNFYCGELSFEFIGGIVLYHLYCRFNKNENKILANKKTKLIILSFLGAISYGFLIFSEMHEFYLSSYRSVNSGIPAFILVGSLLFLENNIKNNEILRLVSLKIGDASYMMYLIHFHMQIFFVNIVFSRITIFSNSFIAIEIMKFLFTSAIIIAISMVMHKFIDKPIQSYFRKKIKISSVPSYT
jgi:peptidoglycan/LPS O-acetylase OafA/YrhL